MQPYFFPYIGYFALIAQTDRWIVFDITQYTPKSWMNRNRVLNPQGGWVYVSVPLRDASRSQSICDVRIADPASACAGVLGKLSHYRKRAPFAAKVEEIVRSTFAGTTLSLVDVNVRGLQRVCEYLEVPFRYDICSEMQLDLPESMHPGGWAPHIASLVGADDYINPLGGHALFDRHEFESQGVRLQFLEPPDLVYQTVPFVFEPALSILDVLMWNRADEVRDVLHRARILTPEEVAPKI
ncbi:MAG: WbqC family protein [Vulcanimicrobiaceae bacterium]